MSSPTRKIIILSGHNPNTQETAAKMICESFPLSMHLKLSEPIKNAVHSLYGRSCSYNAYEKVKEQSHLDFMGLSPRTAYGQMADWVKNVYGSDFCGQILTRTIENFGSKRLFVISELEHSEQARPLIDLVGQENILHLKLLSDNLETINGGESGVHLPNIRTHKITDADNRQHLLKSRIHDYVDYWIQDRDGFTGQSRVA